MKLSVIIPVYNVEHTLDRCVESVLGQDVSDMEVILVDDGFLCETRCCYQTNDRKGICLYEFAHGVFIEIQH